jgi:hypothetical protein
VFIPSTYFGAYTNHKHITIIVKKTVKKREERKNREKEKKAKEKHNSTE